MHRPSPQRACNLQIKECSCTDVKYSNPSHPNCLLNSSLRAMGIFKNNNINDEDDGGPVSASDSKGSWTSHEHCQIAGSEDHVLVFK